MPTPVLVDAAGVSHLCPFWEGLFVDVGRFDDYFVGTFGILNEVLSSLVCPWLAIGKNN